MKRTAPALLLLTALIPAACGKAARNDDAKSDTASARAWPELKEEIFKSNDFRNPEKLAAEPAYEAELIRGADRALALKEAGEVTDENRYQLAEQLAYTGHHIDGTTDAMIEGYVDPAKFGEQDLQARVDHALRYLDAAVELVPEQVNFKNFRDAARVVKDALAHGGMPSKETLDVALKNSHESTFGMFVAVLIGRNPEKFPMSGDYMQEVSGVVCEFIGCDKKEEQGEGAPEKPTKFTRYNEVGGAVYLADMMMRKGEELLRDPQALDEAKVGEAYGAIMTAQGILGVAEDAGSEVIPTWPAGDTLAVRHERLDALLANAKVYTGESEAAAKPMPERDFYKKDDYLRAYQCYSCHPGHR